MGKMRRGREERDRGQGRSMGGREGEGFGGGNCMGKEATPVSLELCAGLSEKNVDVASK